MADESLPLAEASIGTAHDDERPRKRLRSHSPAMGKSIIPIQQDPDYFFSDGSTYVLVQRTLFRVHRTILSKDSSAFETMFTLPPAQGNDAEGGREENPVVLQGDTPEQFRSLLWALYAMPHEIMQAGCAKRDWSEFDRFCDIVHIAHKYGFKGLEAWALETFTRWVGPRQPSSRHPHAYGTNTPCPDCELNLDRLRRVLELAALCDNEFLRSAAVSRLQEELRQPHADLPWFIMIAERFDITVLLGIAYYALMIKGRDKWVSLARAGRLSPAQLGKLHNGFYALVSMWQMLRVTPPPIPTCTHMCKGRWASYWKELLKDDAIAAKFPADVIGRLDIAQSRFYTNLRVLDLEQDCRGAAVAAVRKLMNDTREGLAYHFVDLP